MRIDLNADVGEGYDDDALFRFVSSVSIACGGHAGDDGSMARAIALALEARAAVGAHPGYPDRESMGRRPLDIDPIEVRRTVREQIERLSHIAWGLGARVTHVKPHGALYNQAAGDPWLASSIADAVRATDPRLILVGLSGSWLTAAGRTLKLSVADEAFADRRYRADGTLAPRGLDDALITDPVLAAEQALAIARGVPIDSVDGPSLTVNASTICLHSDTPGAVENARAVRDSLQKVGFTIEPL